MKIKRSFLKDLVKLHLLKLWLKKSILQTLREKDSQWKKKVKTLALFVLKLMNQLEKPNKKWIINTWMGSPCLWILQKERMIEDVNYPKNDKKIIFQNRVCSHSWILIWCNTTICLWCNNTWIECTILWCKDNPTKEIHSLDVKIINDVANYEKIE